MKRTLIWCRDKFMLMKIYILRSSGYISLINLGMIMFLAIAKLKDTGIISFDIGNYMIPFYFATLLLLAIFGYIDIKIFKGYKSEVDIVYNQTPLHPELIKMQTKIDYLYGKAMKGEVKE